MTKLNVITVGEFIEDLIAEIEKRIEEDNKYMKSIDWNSISVSGNYSQLAEAEIDTHVRTGRIDAFNDVLTFIDKYK